jgi:FkbM family methyltransferase
MTLKLRDDVDYKAYKSLQYDRHFMPRTEIEPKTVLDVGCWLGYTTREFALRWPKAEILAVDADADNAVLAIENCQQLANITVMHAAVGAPGQTILSGPAKNSRSLHSDSEEDEVTVNVVSVDQLLDAHGWGNQLIDFAKFDVEGAEVECLEGEWLKRCDCLMIDLHGTYDKVKERLGGFNVVRNPRSMGAPDGTVWAWREIAA